MNGAHPSSDAPPRLFAGLLVAAALLLLPGLGGIGLWAPDEPRYAQVAEEIRSFEHGWRGLVVLHLNGRPYDQKPPLYYWAAAAAGAPLGHVSEAAARLPSALAAIGCVALVVRFGRDLVGGRAALLAGAMLLTSQELAYLGRRVQLDVLLTLFTTAAFWAIWRLDRGDGRRLPNLLLLHGSLGLAALTKGPVGWLPLLVAAVWLAWERRAGDWRRLAPAWSTLFSVGPLLAWFAGTILLKEAASAGSADTSGWVHGAVVDNLFGRFFRGTSHERPFYYFVYNFPILFLPWSLLWPLVVPATRSALAPAADATRARAWRFLLAWIATLFVFFSLSSGKRGLYLLPAAPAAALVTADALLRALRDRDAWPRWAARTCAGVASLLALAAAGVVVAGPSLPHPVPRLFGGAALASLALAAAAWRAFAAPAPASRAAARALGGTAVAQVFAVAAGVLLLLLSTFLFLFPSLDDEKSPRNIALAAARLVPPGQRIGLVGERGLIGGIAYYAERRVAPLDDADDVARFLAEGGRAVVVRTRSLDRVESVTPVEIHERARSGRRELVLVTPVASAPAAATAR